METDTPGPGDLRGWKSSRALRRRSHSDGTRFGGNKRKRQHRDAVGRETARFSATPFSVGAGAAGLNWRFQRDGLATLRAWAKPHRARYVLSVSTQSSRQQRCLFVHSGKHDFLQYPVTAIMDEPVAPMRWPARHGQRQDRSRASPIRVCRQSVTFTARKSDA